MLRAHQFGLVQADYSCQMTSNTHRYSLDSERKRDKPMQAYQQVLLTQRFHSKVSARSIPGSLLSLSYSTTGLRILLTPADQCAIGRLTAKGAEIVPSVRPGGPALAAKLMLLVHRLFSITHNTLNRFRTWTIKLRNQ